MKRRKAHCATKEIPPLTNNVRPQVLFVRESVHCNVRNNSRIVHLQQTLKMRAMKLLVCPLMAYTNIPNYLPAYVTPQEELKKIYRQNASHLYFTHYLLQTCNKDFDSLDIAFSGFKYLTTEIFILPCTICQLNTPLQRKPIHCSNSISEPLLSMETKDKLINSSLSSKDNLEIINYPTSSIKNTIQIQQ